MRDLVSDIRTSLGGRVWLLVGLTFLNALLEGAAIALLLPLLVVLGMGGGGGGIVVTFTERLLATLGLPLAPSSVGILLAAVLAFGCAVFLLQARLGTSLQARYAAQWQARLAAAMLGARWTHLRDVPGGDFASAIAVEAPRIGAAFYQANLIFTSTAFIAVQGVIALVLAPEVAIALVILGLVLFAATRVLSRRAAAGGRVLTEGNAELLGRLAETGRGLKTIKAGATESEALARIVPAVRRIEHASASTAFDVQLSRAVFEYGGGAAIAALLIAGPVAAGMDVASILVVVAVFVRLFPKITALRQCLQSLDVVLPAFRTLRRIEAAAAAAAETAGESSIGASGPAALAFEDVSVRTPDGRLILDGVSLAVAPGEFVAFVGPSGAGKTTIADAMLGLVEPAAGRVLVDGRQLGPGSMEAWRRSIGYLGQEPVLFSGTIADNVRWGRPGLSDAAVMAALAAAAAGSLGSGAVGARDPALPVGEGGNALSGGERQRVALARALAEEPRLLVLDEATSALDPEAEQMIVSGLAALAGKVTIVAVAHRLWSVRGATRICVVQQGRIVQAGRFDELAAQPGWFSEMLSRQQVGP